MTDRPSVPRYVVTYINKDGMRTLCGPAQGRCTNATRAGANRELKLMLEANNHDKLRSIFGPTCIEDFEVRAVACYPVHFDPQTVWFD